MGLGKPQRSAKFEVAGFIYYEKIKEFVLKNWDKQNEETPYYLEKLILTLDSQTQCFLFDVQLLWSYDYSKWAIFTKNRILQLKILSFWGWSVGFKMFGPKYQKAHPYAKSGRLNCLAYMPIVLF